MNQPVTIGYRKKHRYRYHAPYRAETVSGFMGCPAAVSATLLLVWVAHYGELQPWFVLDDVAGGSCHMERVVVGILLLQLRGQNGAHRDEQNRCNGSTFFWCCVDMS